MNASRNVLSGGLLERPLTARSVVLSLLLGRRPPWAPVALLVRWCALFGISENSARVALSRMVERGELAVDEATYALAGRMIDRQVDQDTALAAVPQPWSGTWLLVITGRAARTAPDRQRARDALRNLHFAEWREGVWTRPDNLMPPAASSIGDDALVWNGVPMTDDPSALAEELFGLVAWADRGHELLRELHGVTQELDVGGLAAAFVAGAATLQHLRRDPLMPDELLPLGWPGQALRDAYTSYQTTFSQAVAAWWRSAS